MPNKKLYISFFKAFLSFSLIGCCTGGNMETARYYLTEDDKLSIPYSVQQSISFIHSNGYSFDLIVTDESTKMQRTETEHCDTNFASYEVKDFVLQSFIPEFYITVTYSALPYLPALYVGINGTQFYFDTNRDPDLASAQIGELTYADVYFADAFIADSTFITPQRLWFTKANGIIQIQMTNGETYSINN